MLCLTLLWMLNTNANAQKISSPTPVFVPIEAQLLDCKRAYIKLSNERDTVKAMFIDSLMKHSYERVTWKKSTEKQVKEAEKVGFWKGVKWGGGTGILITVLIWIK